MPRQASSRTATAMMSVSTPRKQSRLRISDDTPNSDFGEQPTTRRRQALQEIPHMNSQSPMKQPPISPMRKLNTARRGVDNNTDRNRGSMREKLRESIASAVSELDENDENDEEEYGAPGRKPSSKNGHKSISVQAARVNGKIAKGQIPALQSKQRDTLDLESALTPAKRPVPILANFEEWMKLATDNKINAANSWNFALIDYFHDMSLLKDGPGGQVNFQKASCTLDGCVKIYTSRVDSVATETGRLLSGLAESADGNGKKGKKGEDDDEEDGEEGDEEDEDSQKKKRKKPTRSHEATLAPSFAALQLKKLELEFAVDPLFKKASADFDEGGAKGLLLNHLSIDSSGRIVFDSCDDAVAASPAPADNVESDDRGERDDEDKTKVETKQEDNQEQEEADQEIDLSQLAAKFFPDLSALDAKDLCPSMRNFTLGDPSSSLEIPLLKSPEEWRGANKTTNETNAVSRNLDLADQTGIFLDGSNDLGFDDDDDGGLMAGFDMPEDVGFGEGGEAWAKEAALEPELRTARADDGPLDDNLIEGENGDGYTVSLQHRYREDAEQESIMAYFDKAFNSRGKGKTAMMSLESWRIQKIQKAKQSEGTTTTTRAKKEKEPFEIDFLGPMSKSLKDLLEAPAVSNSTISLPRTQLKTKGRNLLDKDDEIVDVMKMMRLWTKPKCRIGRRRGGMEVIDEGFGSKERVGSRPTTQEDDEEDIESRKGDYDANFFADDEPILPFAYDGPLPIDDDDDDEGIGGGADDGIGFVDAREMLSPGPQGLDPSHSPHDPGEEPLSSSQQLPESQFPAPEMLPGSFGAQLITQQGRRLRPEYVNYARTAKKVDVRALKENMWKGMSDRLISLLSFDQSGGPPTPALTDGDGDTDMMDIDSEPEPHRPVTPNDVAANTTPLADKLDGGNDSLKFTSLMSDLRDVYPENQMKDISTSYCFICLLHLANEKGLVLEGGREDGSMDEIVVKRDPGIGEGYVGE